jgi:hypothetical protein
MNYPTLISQIQELSDINITNAGNYLILISKTQEQPDRYHKYRELPDIDITNTGTTWH